MSRVGIEEPASKEENQVKNINMKVMKPLKKKNTDEIKDPEQATLTLPDGRTFSLDVFHPSLGDEVFIDVTHLQSEAGVVAYDPGFTSTSACSSSITFIDGAKGDCRYRGYSVPDLVEKCDYIEVCYLILYGDLPSQNMRKKFAKQIQSEMLVHERFRRFFEGFLTGSHPMAILTSVVAALSSFFEGSDFNFSDVEERELAVIRLVAKMPTIAAMAYKTIIGQPYVYPRADLSYAENFLRMMFKTPMEDYVADPLHVEIINAFLIIHADHEQNASTSTVRTAGSSRAHPYACVAAGITSLWGPAHGGANEAVLKMLREIGSVKEVPSFIERVKRKEVLLMGFGHRIYKNYDPRATVMRLLCHKLLTHMEDQKGQIGVHGSPQLFSTGRSSPGNSPRGGHDPLFDVALALEAAALSDQYFMKRKLYPNVDFYSGLVMKALGIPEEMFTVMFALGRSVGWLAHWKEMVEAKQMKICRPRQLYVGHVQRDLEKDLKAAHERNDEDNLSPFHVLRANQMTTLELQEEH
eukprot:GHVN01084330.1.p1 GENE.GHVN01084330.1~~GHVN01084330.1.p1  ORF type:complete len:558 (+),score=92.61 GHVN01084330.1:103-1674(+)